MKQSYSNLLRKMVITIYQPIVTRIELHSYVAEGSESHPC